MSLTGWTMSAGRSISAVRRWTEITIYDWNKRSSRRSTWRHTLMVAVWSTCSLTGLATKCPSRTFSQLLCNTSLSLPPFLAPLRPRHFLLLYFPPLFPPIPLSLPLSLSLPYSLLSFLPSPTLSTLDIWVCDPVVRSFKPDFVLVRQHPVDAMEDWKNIILGLQFAGVPCINSLAAIYNMLDKPWVVSLQHNLLESLIPKHPDVMIHIVQLQFSHLAAIQKKLGKEQFPLIEQTYFPNHREMVCMFWVSNSW